MRVFNLTWKGYGVGWSRAYPKRPHVQRRQRPNVPASFSAGGFWLQLSPWSLIDRIALLHYYYTFRVDDLMNWANANYEKAKADNEARKKR